MIESPLFGCPGIINFLDARTRWLDDVVCAAIGDGISQVGGAGAKEGEEKGGVWRQGQHMQAVPMPRRQVLQDA